MNEPNPNVEVLAALAQALLAPPKPPAPSAPVPRAHPETMSVLRSLVQAVGDLLQQKTETNGSWHEIELLNRFGQVERTMRVRRVMPPAAPNLFSEPDK